MKVKIESFMSFKYLEVYEITRWKDGCIYEAKKLNKFINAVDEEKLDTNKFVTTSISTSMIRSEFITLDVENAEFFDVDT